MKDHVAEVNRFNASKRDCAKEKREHIENFTRLENELTELREDHCLSKDRIKALEIMVEQKAEENTIVEIQSHLKLLPTKAEVIELRSHMKTCLEKFGK